MLYRTLETVVRDIIGYDDVWWSITGLMAALKKPENGSYSPDYEMVRLIVLELLGAGLVESRKVFGISQFRWQGQ